MALLSNPRAGQVLLTLGVFQFVGPILRDVGVTHLLNPGWSGHARFHLMWMLVFMAGSGLANLVLIWKVADRRALWTVWTWQLCNVLGFWGAAALAGAYGGQVVDPEFHARILGLNENVFVFVLVSLLSLLTLGALSLGERERASEVRHG